MKIQSATITMSSQQSMAQIDTKEESLKYWVGQQRPDAEARSSSGQPLTADLLELSEQARNMLSNGNNPVSEIETDNTIEYTISAEDKLKIVLLEEMLSKLTGKKIKFMIMDKVKLQDVRLDCPTTTKAAADGSPVQPSGWGLEYDYHENHYEQETLSFEANGAIQTADGQKIDFTVQLKMSREFASRVDLRIRAGDAVLDPLVLNFEGNAPQLSSHKFLFDLDSNGTLEDISFVDAGSGFLALDNNNDGVINNGQELFGPSTGNGFGELQQYDSDGNDWIDANDPVYEHLRIWTKDGNGNDRLLALGQQGFGAIYLGNINTPFSLKNQGNQLLGNLKSTGIYLQASGKAGMVHQIDLVV